MLGDVKAQTKPELTKDCKKSKRKNSLQTEAKLLGLDSLSSVKRGRLSQRRLSSGSSGGSCTSTTRTKRRHLAVMAKGCCTYVFDLQYMTLAMKHLSSVDDWNFNVFTLDLLTNGRSLFHMTLQLFYKCGFIEVFQLDIVRLMRCLALVESGYYFSNPYHNSVHAADVVQAMYCNLQEPQISQHLRPIEKMAAIVAAASHDLDHPGVNQAFLIATSNPLASLYNNISVLENHHWRAMIGILRESRVFEHLDRNTWNEILTLTQAMILATDITRQQEILGSFRDHLQKGSLDLQSKEAHRSFVLQITLKCADICNPCRPWLLSKRWSEMICEEFFRQGDCERKLNLPVAPFCDRFKSSVATIQTGFMANVVEPLFIEWNRFLASSLTSVQLQNLRLNRSKWDEIIAQDRLDAQTMTVIACTEATPRTPDRSFQTVVHCCQSVVVDLDALCSSDDKENANPLLNESDLINKLANRLGGINGHRRHSLPTDRVPSDDQGTCPAVPASAAAECRRHSLPNCGGNCPPASLASSNRRLSSLVECSPVGDDHFDFDRNSNVRPRSSQQHQQQGTRSPNPSSNTRLGLLSDLGGGSNRRRSDVPATGYLRPDDTSSSAANPRRASYPLNAINDAVTRSSNAPSSTDCSNPEIGCPPRQSSCIISPSSVLRPPNKKTGNCRKLSLEEAHHRAANSENKRSRSLATSTLLYPVDENLSRMKIDMLSNAQAAAVVAVGAAPGDTVGGWRGAASGNTAGLVNASYLEQRCQGDGGSTEQINHYLTMNKVHKTKNARCQAGNISGNDAYSVGDRLASPPVRTTTTQATVAPPPPPLQTIQVLSSRPIMARTVDVHSRPPKGVTRKATSVFTASAADGEVVPLLPKRVDLHSCEDDI